MVVTSMLASYLREPRERHTTAAKGALTYLNGTKMMKMKLNHKDNDELTTLFDGSWGKSFEERS